MKKITVILMIALIFGCKQNKDNPKIEKTNPEIERNEVLPDGLEKISENKYQRKLNKMTATEVSNILGIDIDNEFLHSGIVKYVKAPSGEYLKNGAFSLKGNLDSKESENLEFKPAIEIKGNYMNNVPNGIFEKKLTGYENNSITIINYENGVCLWSSFAGSGEGEDYNHREENPKDCSFKYIENKLLEIKGWN